MDEIYLNESLPNHRIVVTIEEGVTDGGFPNRFVDHGPRNILLEEIGLDSMTLFEKIYNFSRKSNE